MTRPVRSSTRRAFLPAPECLEGRQLLYATTGGAFAKPARVTFSFLPDGTNVGGAPSRLMQALDAKFSRQNWQDQFRKAAAVWEAVADVNLDEVGDDGSAIGVAGKQQGDARFGDIRIGGYNQSGSTLGFAFAPPPFNGGTSAGDILVNTAQAWKINGDYDLLTVAIHEIGHSLGMAHSAIASAVQYASYTGMKQGLTADDTAGIQSVYGTRAPDSFDASGSNNTSSTADDITTTLNASGQATLAELDINSASDVDWFYVAAPASTSGTLTVTMQSSDLSLLSPKLVLYNASLQAIGTASAANAFGAIVTISTTASPGQGFYIRAAGANNGPTGAGAYGLQVNFGGGSMPKISPPNTVVDAQPDQGGGSLALREGRIRLLLAGRLLAFGDTFEARRGVGRPQARAKTARQPSGDRPEAMVYIAIPRPSRFPVRVRPKRTP